MNKMEKLGSKVVSQMIKTSKLGWPPECMGYIYQPERPTTAMQKNEYTTGEQYSHKQK